MSTVVLSEASWRDRARRAVPMVIALWAIYVVSIVVAMIFGRARKIQA
jgi:hypothetical protein